jgi:Raf kinase inhibitor-like YbhB/YbcL family protein
VTLPISLKLPLSLVAIGTAVLLAGCSGTPAPVDAPAPDSSPEPAASAVPIVLPVPAKKFTVTSTAFADGQQIPAKYTCAGAGQLPPISWSGDLAGAKLVAIVVDDPDAPAGGYVHWMVTDMPTKPPASIDPDQLPDGAHAASNSDGDPSWTPPCPNPGDTHHYRFTVYALNGPSGISDGTDPALALQELAPHVLAYGRLTGVVTGS